ncbi:MAG: hypothetical protein NT133_11345 [Alphaproteobacteria bacterium]|nr:hypothetical protein [Alphaproteobacteria bacterium]
MEQFTLVRHGLYAVAADPRYEDQLEVSEVTSEQAYRVRAAGGALFAARAAAELALAGAPRGHFANVRINGAEAFVPAPPKGGMI